MGEVRGKKKEVRRKRKEDKINALSAKELLDAAGEAVYASLAYGMIMTYWPAISTFNFLDFNFFSRA